MARPLRELTPYRSNRDFYGAEMRRHRTGAEMSFDTLAARIPYSKSQLHRVETAEMLPPPGLSAALDRLFGTDGLFDRLSELVRQSQEIHPEQYRRSMRMEARAQLIEVYSGELVPGLLQTAAYAQALFRVSKPQASDEGIQELVAARLSRQERLRSVSPPRLSVILNEAVVRRPVGGPAVMREQLAAVLDVADTRTTVVQLLPFRNGEHALMGGTLKLMTLDDGTSVAWDESIVTGVLLEDEETVCDCRDKYDLLRTYALPPGETASFIRTVMEELSA
ncbi:helix-turn-helix domain-containing protein [Streptomyces sulfonofaciens]|nr:helix-turn-helix transcriptional regulator [Streptomyces sulfonofaciens]